MGIKGIYGEIGAGRRVALAKLSAEKLADTGRPLRIAVDISIWLFQVQSSAGGSNPALRTLYYRLVRILGLNIHPLFVFDGANRPPFKRNAATGNGGQIISRQARRLLDLFNFSYRIAPGEAEAECAALQRQGVVDYVLSEDVDTLSFGCTATMRNWSSINERGRGAPTHVTVFESESIKSGKSGLDREGMILIALMSGGDYLPAGVPRCGIKLACEAARAGFGQDLCQIAPDDDNGYHEWRERLRHELVTNESGFFRTKHKALQIPDDFPDRTVLKYHAYPEISSAEDIQMLKDHLQWGGEPDIRGLRDYLDEAFEWKHLSGAKKFLRNIAPALLNYKLHRQASISTEGMSLEEQTEREDRLIGSIMARRTHISTDGISEIKVAYIPACVVGLDLDNEIDEEDEAEDTSEEEDPEISENLRSWSASPIKRSRLKEFDPWKPQQTWIPEHLLLAGAPLSLERWEAAMRDPRVASNRKLKTGGMQQGALENYLRVTKPGQTQRSQSKNMGDPFEEKVQRLDAISRSNASIVALAEKKKVAKSSRGRSTQKPAAPVDRRLNPWSIARKDHEMREEELEQDQYDLGGCTNTRIRADSPGKKTMDDSYLVQRQQHVVDVAELNTATHSLPKVSPSKAPCIASSTRSTTPRHSKHSNVVVRESLEGTWKLAEDFDSLSITPRRRFSQVDTLDLTTS